MQLWSEAFEWDGEDQRCQQDFLGMSARGNKVDDDVGDEELDNLLDGMRGFLVKS